MHPWEEHIKTAQKILNVVFPNFWVLNFAALTISQQRVFGCNFVYWVQYSTWLNCVWFLRTETIPAWSRIWGKSACAGPSSPSCGTHTPGSESPSTLDMVRGVTARTSSRNRQNVQPIRQESGLHFKWSLQSQAVCLPGSAEPPKVWGLGQLPWFALPMDSPAWEGRLALDGNIVLEVMCLITIERFQ